MKSIVAIIVTYNRKQKLLTCITRVLSQIRPVQKIIVIDNASTDGTRQAVLDLKNPLIEIETQPQNIGGAAGFTRGMEIGYYQGYDKLWLFDDDCYPDPLCLLTLDEILNKHYELHGSIAGWVAPHVNTTWTEYDKHSQPEPLPDYTRFYKFGFEVLLAQRALWLGLLIPAEQIKAHGFSRGEYNMWYDDGEWTWRVAQKSAGLYVPHARVLHDSDIPTGFFGFMGINDHTLWKHVSCTRNIASHKLEIGGESEYQQFCHYINDQITLHGLNASHASAIRQALIDGYEFRPPIRYPNR